MTIELCIALPALIVIAVIAVNGLTFFAQCAEFDRIARNAVRLYATSPEYGESKGDAVPKIAMLLDESIEGDNVSCDVQCTTSHEGYATYKMTLEFSPTLFDMGLRSEIFGVPLPRLTHSTALTVDPYRPGMLF